MPITLTKLSATPERLTYFAEGTDAMAAVSKTNAQLIADTVPGPLRTFLESFTLSLASQGQFAENISIGFAPGGGLHTTAGSWSVEPRPDAGMSGPVAFDVSQTVAPGMGENAYTAFIEIQFLHSIIR